MPLLEPDLRKKTNMNVNWLDKLFEEKDGFCEYIEILEDGEIADPAVRMSVYEMAKEESQHFKRIYDILFKDASSKTMTPMEHSIHHHMEHMYKWMTEKLAEIAKNIK